MIFELFYFIISGTTIILKGVAMEPDTVVPTHIVQYCGKLNNVDPYDPHMSGLNELKLYDCYSALMGYYDDKPLEIVYRMHLRTDKVGQ